MKFDKESGKFIVLSDGEKKFLNIVLILFIGLWWFSYYQDVQYGKVVNKYNETCTKQCTSRHLQYGQHIVSENHLKYCVCVDDLVKTYHIAYSLIESTLLPNETINLSKIFWQKTYEHPNQRYE